MDKPKRNASRNQQHDIHKELIALHELAISNAHLREHTCSLVQAILQWKPDTIRLPLRQLADASKNWTIHNCTRRWTNSTRRLRSKGHSKSAITLHSDQAWQTSRNNLETWTQMILPHRRHGWVLENKRIAIESRLNGASAEMAEHKYTRKVAMN